MDINSSISSDEVIQKLIEMGFGKSVVFEAIKNVGPSLGDSIEYIINASQTSSLGASSSSTCSQRKGRAIVETVVASSSGQMRQSSILDHFHSKNGLKRSRIEVVAAEPVSGSRELSSSMQNCKECLSPPRCDIKIQPDIYEVDWQDGPDSDWEKKVNSLLRMRFGFSSLKKFQKEALGAWTAHQDCLVLAATGSGKSLCFQIPALLTGKVVVVISPLISLMHDQCLKLAKHGISACFLGSGQPDKTIENKAMKGMYSIIYVCPETILRLIQPLQTLAETRGIALFAIDEVHCVSKWGHDFRPDYRRLSVLREKFSSSNLKFLRFDIPLMALTATATINVREDILKSLCMSKETKIVLSSFFRSNLRFFVKHSRTSSPSSYKNDFHELIDIYARKRNSAEKKQAVFLQDIDDGSDNSANGSISKASASFTPANDIDDVDDCCSEEEYNEANSMKGDGSSTSKGREMSIEYLENEVDVFHNEDDWDVASGEFCGQFPQGDWEISGLSQTVEPPDNPEERVRLCQEPLAEGPTIIYVPTRKETIRIAKYLCGFGVKAAAYNASLPKSHLRKVHKEFHENTIEVVVATIAFGMGIDKSNVRRIIHYGWPQSLEAYYQEAGRAGRDGKLADCILLVNLSRVPSLLPNRRSEEQMKQAYKMLSDCFRYGMNTSSCRAKKLVEYFGEVFNDEKCLLCDVCVKGPPERQNLKEEADILMQVIAAYHVRDNFAHGSCNDAACSDIKGKLMGKPNLRTFVSKIREQSQKFLATDLLWWRGLARIMDTEGYLREGDDKIHVQLKFPEPTQLGLELLSKGERAFHVYPEADMLLSMSKSKSFSTFSEWGRGWADPDIRRQRLEKRQSDRKPRRAQKPRKRKSRKPGPEFRTARGRIAEKLFKKK